MTGPGRGGVIRSAYGIFHAYVRCFRTAERRGEPTGSLFVGLIQILRASARLREPLRGAAQIQCSRDAVRGPFSRLGRVLHSSVTDAAGVSRPFSQSHESAAPAARARLKPFAGYMLYSP